VFTPQAIIRDDKRSPSRFPDQKVIAARRRVTAYKQL